MSGLRAIRWLAIGLGAFLTLILTTAAWLTQSTSGARWLYQRASALAPGSLSIATIDGSVSGPLTIRGLVYRDADAGIELTVDRLQIDLALLALWRRSVVIEAGAADGVRLHLTEPRDPPDDKPLSFEAPIAVEIRAFELRDGVVSRHGEALVDIKSAHLQAVWSGDTLAIQRLDLDARQGEVQLAGSVAGAKPYRGQLRGNFVWRQADQPWAGSLSADAAGAQVAAVVRLQRPIVANLRTTLGQDDELPWQMLLDIPPTDPRGLLLADSSTVRKLGAALRGSGTLSGGQVSGYIDLNAERLHIERLQVNPGDPATRIDGLLRWGAGQLTIAGDVHTTVEPVVVDLGVNWRDFSIPADLAGQLLQTRGKVSVKGTSQSYRAVGDVALGPPGRLADLQLALTGSTEMVALERLALKQPQGELTASGRIAWIPEFSGTVAARARQFNPGELFSGWPGSLVNGTANLSLGIDRILTGSLDLQTNDSRLQISSTRVAQAGGDAMDAEATMSIRSLGAWLPDATGSATARLSARGTWPQFAVSADLRAAELRGVAAGLSEFGAVVTAIVSDTGVRGSIDTLQFAADTVGTVNLRQPARFEYADRSASLSQSCLGSEKFSACFAGELQASGAGKADYQVERIPLALALALSGSSAPLSIDGAIDGAGTIQRTATGELSGMAQLRSARGAISQSAESGPSATPLLTYNDLQLNGEFSGRDVTLTIGAKLDQNGDLDGRLTATGVGKTSTALAGSVSAKLPSVAVLGVLTPQLVDVRGSAALQASIAGTLQQPRITGQLTVSEFASDVPRLGLKLHNGQLRITPQDDGRMQLAGSLESGEGKLQFAGTAALDGATRIAIKGENFLAADFPGVRVIATPDLVFQRSEEQLSLTGYVSLPRADIDLARLPRGTRPQTASDDVVIVDADDSGAATERSLPLTANIRIDLGDNVKLAGYGLDAKVSGALMVRERSGEPTTGSGEVRVAGTYKAYGQDLTIRQGQLLYAATPLDNPRLTIVAVRSVGTVTAGLRVTGPAKNPQLSVFSDPAMGEANALSYLVAGKPLDQIGSGDGDAMTAAARSLGTAAGGLLAKNIGSRLGIDEVGISDNEMIGGAALTVGQYLSPRLYLSYGVGLFDPGEVITLRYKLSDELALKVEQGNERSRGGIEYRIEK